MSLSNFLNLNKMIQISFEDGQVKLFLFIYLFLFEGELQMISSSDKKNLWAFPKAQHIKLPASCEGQYRQAGRAAPGWISSCWWRVTCWLPFFHHHLVLNPSKSVSLWRHTCATSYQGLWQSISFSANVALLQSRSALLSTFYSNPAIIGNTATIKQT